MGDRPGAPRMWRDRAERGRRMHPWPLPAHELHVWRASLDVGSPRLQVLAMLLSADERERAARFHFERDRSRYTAGRGILRMLLGGYTGADSADLRFAYGEYGKPSLVFPANGPHFNLSHSGPVALLAFSSSAEVGVDVELMDKSFAAERIAERFFSPGEVAALRALPPNLQPRAFLHCWTRKEAFIKARGDGLSLPLDSFDVSLDPTQPASVRRTAWSEQEPRQWGMVDLSDKQGQYIGAVASRSLGWHVVSRSVQDIIGDQIQSDQEDK